VSVVVLDAVGDVVLVTTVVLDPVVVLPFANDNEHFLTSSTAGLPSLSVIGVRVISQISVTGPAFLSRKSKRVSEFAINKSLTSELSESL
jgi:hypothetical protein